LSWRTKGYFKPLSRDSEPLPHVEFTFRCPKFRVWYVVLEALVDTGSPFTAISPRDARRLQIPLSKLPRHSTIHSISFASFSFTPRLLHGAELIFKDDEGKRHSLGCEPFYALEPTKWEEGVFRLPNVIGMDFIRKNKAFFIASPPTEVVLEFREY